MSGYAEYVQSSMSDYDRVGGASVVAVVVDRFYELVLADERLGKFFVGADMRGLKRHQTMLVSQAMGGPADYNGALGEAHAGRGITTADFGRVVALLAQALREADVSEEIIGRVGAVLGETQPDVVMDGEG
jgi:hemoglobin